MSQSMSPDRKVNVTGIIRWVSVLEARASSFAPDKEKFSLQLIVPKDDPAVANLRKAVDAAIADKWGSKPPKTLRFPVRDGDEKAHDGTYLKTDEMYRGAYYINASSTRKPMAVWGKEKRQITPEDQLDGRKAVVLLSAFAYDATVNSGVSLGLDGVWVIGRGIEIGMGAMTAGRLSGVSADVDDALDAPAGLSGDIDTADMGLIRSRGFAEAPF